MKNKKLLFVSILSTLAIGLSVGCRKNQQANEAAEIGQQSNSAESTSMDLQVMGDEAASGPASFQPFAAACANLSYDTTGVNVRITVDYGSTNCLCEDGRYRRGKVYIDYNGGNYYAIGNVIVFTTDNFYVNDNKIQGKRVVRHPAQDQWTIEADATITFTDNAGTATWKSERTRIQTGGQSTPLNIFDNTYEITGSATGITAQGRGYEIEISSPLLIQLNCRYIKSGELTIKSDGLKKEAILDYGSGECDNQATLTYRGKVKQLNL
ncbi:MAG: hypothetical protein N4A41_09505 [Crocinitomicaceae bacterium]|jgi:hypothetical protein|nr:hypothetical protein [Crocinitomicaceae bacterium]